MKEREREGKVRESGESEGREIGEGGERRWEG